jgi:predicted TIM-barrel fold metal-dependent hydrolase
MTLFDAHLHLFSRRYFEAVAAASPLPGTVAERIDRLAKTMAIEVPGPDLGAHVRRWLADLDRHGVERAVTFASAPEEADAVAEAARLAGGRFVPVALVNPKAAGTKDRVRDLLATKGFRGILLFPALHQYRLQGPEAAEVVREAAGHGAVVYVQCGLLKVPVRDALGFPRVVDLSFANPLDLVPLASSLPGTTFVVPHFGAGFFRDALLLCAQCENVVLDTSSSNSWMVTEPAGLSLPDVLQRALAVTGPTRLLFGTDSATFPRGFRGDLLEAQREAIRACGATPADRDLILGGNAERIFSAPTPRAVAQ